MTVVQIQLRQLLEAAKGAANAIPRARLAYAVGVSDRKLRDMIHELRMGGYPIGSSSAVCGYYWIDTPEEKAATIRDLKAHAFQTLAVMNRLEKKPLYIAAEKAMQIELELS